MKNERVPSLMELAMEIKAYNERCAEAFRGMMEEWRAAGYVMLSGHEYRTNIGEHGFTYALRGDGHCVVGCFMLDKVSEEARLDGCVDSEAVDGETLFLDTVLKNFGEWDGSFGELFDGVEALTGMDWDGLCSRPLVMG